MGSRTSSEGSAEFSDSIVILGYKAENAFHQNLAENSWVLKMPSIKKCCTEQKSCSPTPHHGRIGFLESDRINTLDLPPNVDLLEILSYRIIDSLVPESPYSQDPPSRGMLRTGCGVEKNGPSYVGGVA